jgi:hypothetical protein
MAKHMKIRKWQGISLLARPTLQLVISIQAEDEMLQFTTDEQRHYLFCQFHQIAEAPEPRHVAGFRIVPRGKFYAFRIESQQMRVDLVAFFAISERRNELGVLGMLDVRKEIPTKRYLAGIRQRWREFARGNSG